MRTSQIGAKYLLDPGIKFRHQPLGRDESIRLVDDLGPVDVNVHIDAEPAPVSGIGWPEDPLLVLGDQLLLCPRQIARNNGSGSGMSVMPDMMHTNHDNRGRP